MNYKTALGNIDEAIINYMRGIFLPFARFAIFLIFFWFGMLKVIGASPASPMVVSLLKVTMPFISPDIFLVGFGIFEMLIGISFIVPHLERVAIALLLAHMVTTTMPLFMLESMAWQGTFVPTLEGQYIIKNILFIALAIGIATQLRPRQF